MTGFNLEEFTLIYREFGGCSLQNTYNQNVQIDRSGMRSYMRAQRCEFILSIKTTFPNTDFNFSIQ